MILGLINLIIGLILGAAIGVLVLAYKVATNLGVADRWNKLILLITKRFVSVEIDDIDLDVEKVKKKTSKKKK